MSKTRTKGLPYQTVEFSQIAVRMRKIVINRYKVYGDWENQLAELKACARKLEAMARENSKFYAMQVKKPD